MGSDEIKIRPIRPTIIEMDEKEYDDFMERFYNATPVNEERMNKIREELRQRRAARGKSR